MSSREKIRQPLRKNARLKEIQHPENQYQDQAALLQPAVPATPLNQAASLQLARP
jgi:hypothetical protein